MFSKRSRAISQTISIVVIVIIVVAIVAGAGLYISTRSSSSASTSVVSTATGTNSNLTTFDFGFNGPPDVTDTPGFMLWQAAGQMVGLNIVPSYWGGNVPLLFQALQSGRIVAAEIGENTVQDANLGTGNTSGSYPFVMFGTYEATLGDVIVVKNSIQNWSQMAGQPLAVNTGSQGTPFYCHYMETLHNIPTGQQDCAVIGGETSRAGALFQGKVAGAVLEPFNTINALERGTFHILDIVPNALPALVSETLFTTSTFMKAHPQLIVKFEEAQLIADRMAHNETTFLKYELASFPGSNETTVGAAWKVWMGLRFWDPYGNALTTASLTSLQNEYIKTGGFACPPAPSSCFIPTADEFNASVQPDAVAAIGNYTGPVLGYPDNSVPTMNVVIPGIASILGGASGSGGVLSIVPENAPLARRSPL